MTADSLSTDARWEAAYERFETPAEELRKFRSRLQHLGVAGWPRESRIAEVFCGRGSGVLAWRSLGFQSVSGFDLSLSLLRVLEGWTARCAADARLLPVASASVDVVSIQGGLHHLASVDEVERVLDEIVRVLTPTGRFVSVEPWPTLFLGLVHAMCRSRLMRAIAPKLDALSVMIENERETYERWLGNSAALRVAIERRFEPRRLEIRFGKLWLIGVPRKERRL